MDTHFNPGTLVRLHDRDWVVQPSPHDDLLLLKPLGGTDQEIKGVYKKLLLEGEQHIERSAFPLPTEHDLGDFSSARLLYDAARLAFRNGAGPFRSMGKLAFQPRAYQLVPLIMALKLPTVRLLIADDVGIGKTIEALLIVRELLDRADISRFAVVCLPHLCDQWQQELRDKFGIEAALIRSSTVKQLEKKLGPDETIFQHYPYQVISIDYIKGERKKAVFLNHVPDLVIVDEAHTCSQNMAGKNNQQQRHALVKAISEKTGQHLVLRTATPHSGKPEEFQSILGLLKPHFAECDLTEATPAQRREVAKHFVQRRRKNVAVWQDESTPFPQRIQQEKAYQLSKAYREVFGKVLRFARQLVVEDKKGKSLNAQLRYYLAIGLLRGVMSSPATGETMLQKRLDKSVMAQEEEAFALSNRTILDGDFDLQEDQAPSEFAEQATLKDREKRTIGALTAAIAQLRGFANDHKAASARDLLHELLPQHNAIVFCRYIQTANYLGDLLKGALSEHFGKGKVALEVVTSELSDEERKLKVEQLQDSDCHHKLIIATDCMSEGINLQTHFSAVLHYDLPWNPNRLEQREGRIDRFGQSAPEVQTCLLFGEDNPMDGTVLKVLLRKARNIREAIGISVPFPDDSKSIMDAVLTSVLLKPQTQVDESLQTQLDFGEDGVIGQQEAEVEAVFQRIQQREEKITQIYAQEELQPDALLPFLQESNSILGNQGTVKRMVQTALPLLGCTLKAQGKGFLLDPTNLPPDLKLHLPKGGPVSLTFDLDHSKAGCKAIYLQRNHAFVDHLCRKLLENALQEERDKLIHRAAVFRSNTVKERQCLLLLRVRNVIVDENQHKELVAEEMLLWGYEGPPDAANKGLRDPELLQQLRPSQQVPNEEKAAELATALQQIKTLKPAINALAEARAHHMVEGHKRFRKAIKGEHFKSVVPVLPPDVLGLYVVLPEKH
ncbi:MAG: helicase-related protein [Salibacteraceae bacterium]